MYATNTQEVVSYKRWLDRQINTKQGYHIDTSIGKYFYLFQCNYSYNQSF